LYQHGRLLLGCDERTGLQLLRRTAPTQPPQPGQPAQRDGAYVRRGTRTLQTSFVVATGAVVWDLGRTHTRFDFCAHVLRGAKHFADAERFDGVLDHLATHSRLEWCQVRASRNGTVFRPQARRTQAQRRALVSEPSHKHVFPSLPVHGSWLNQVALWFSVRKRQFLRRGDFDAVKDFERRLSW